MDVLDERILAMLRRDGRASFASIAEVVGTSEGTVRNRMRRLQESGRIRGFTVRTAGRQVKALVEARIVPHGDAAAVAGAIDAIDDVTMVFEVTGDEDIVFIADCADTDHLNRVIESVRELPETIATRSRLILQEHPL